MLVKYREFVDLTIGRIVGLLLLLWAFVDAFFSGRRVERGKK